MKSVIHKRNFLFTWGLLATVLVGVGQTALASVSTGNSVTAPLQQNTTTEGRMQTSGTAWGLSDKEWQQYQQVLKGPRATQSPGIDPLMALGLEAKSASERRHFAEMWVREEYARVEKELAFPFSGKWMRPGNVFIPIRSPSTWGMPAALHMTRREGWRYL